MQNPATEYGTDLIHPTSKTESNVSAVSWPAIIAGTFVTVAMTVALLSLGAGVGLAAAPNVMSNGRAGAATFTCLAAVWLIVVQWLSSAFGGYITGRLRTKWTGVHTHEVFFRDTAHGFLTWSVATVLCFGFAVSTAASIAHHAPAHRPMANAGSEAPGASARGPENGGPLAYYVDTLYRSAQPGQTPVDPDTRNETSRILMTDMSSGNVPDADRAYLAQLVATHTGVAQPEAEKRVDDVLNQAKADEVKAQKAAATLSIYTFLSMLVGAFIASAAAALGGRLRDEGYATRPM